MASDVLSNANYAQNYYIPGTKISLKSLLNDLKNESFQGVPLGRKVDDKYTPRQLFDAYNYLMGFYDGSRLNKSCIASNALNEYGLETNEDSGYVMNRAGGEEEFYKKVDNTNAWMFYCLNPKQANMVHTMILASGIMTPRFLDKYYSAPRQIYNALPQIKDKKIRKEVEESVIRIVKNVTGWTQLPKGFDVFEQGNYSEKIASFIGNIGMYEAPMHIEHLDGAQFYFPDHAKFVDTKLPGASRCLQIGEFHRFVENNFLDLRYSQNKKDFTEYFFDASWDFVSNNFLDTTLPGDTSPNFVYNTDISPFVETNLKAYL
ncbi:MAG: hypothetical protein PHN56_06445 [Candidatus Nanoarchaeia archaeon]|nr:hypothetical protein [Candidatus Nanoarchaeia archaeon]